MRANTVTPPPAFDIPSTIATQLRAAAADGREHMTTWLAANPSATDAQVASFIAHSISPVPGEDVKQRELGELAAIRATATPGRDAAAGWYSTKGFAGLHGELGESWWTGEVARFTDRAGGGAQAKAGVDALELATSVAGQATADSQRATHEARPFTFTDPEPVGGWPSNVFTSHPSGHVSVTFAAATVMAGLLPDSAGTYRDVAERVAFSRLYENMHFPHDAVLGARVGAMAGTAALTRLGSRP